MNQKDSSKLQYTRTALNIIKKAGSDNLDDLMGFIKSNDAKPNTLYSYLSAIIAIHRSDPTVFKGNIQPLIDYRDSLKQKINESIKSDNLTQKQKEVLSNIDYEDLLKHINNPYDDHQKYLIYKTAVLYPYRNDLANIKIVKNIKELDKPINALYLPKKGNAILSRKQFKTARTEGPKRETLPIDLSNEIRLLTQDKRTHLFIDSSGKPLTKNNYTQILGRIIESNFGLNFGSSTIRKIYASRNKELYEQLQKDASKLDHSLETHQQHYIKKI